MLGGTIQTTDWKLPRVFLWVCYKGGWMGGGGPDFGIQ